MSKFDASAVLEPLEYNFNPHVDLKGVIPEPDDKQIATYHKAMRAEIKKAMEEMGTTPSQDAVADMTPQEFLKALEKTDQTVEEIMVINRRAAKIYSDLTGGHLTQAQLMKVPPRVRIRFFQWMQQELVVPEVPTGGGNVLAFQKKSPAAG